MDRLLFIAATHGDEGFSVPVLSRLSQEFPMEEYGYNYIIGNPEALKANIRYTQADLNRLAPGDATSDIYEERRAAEIVQYARDYDVVIDIHGTESNCGITTIAPLPTPANLALAELVSLERNVIWYSDSSKLKGPIVQHVQKPALEIECGPKNDPDTASKLEVVLRRLITSNKLGRAAVQHAPKTEQLFYEVYGKLATAKVPPLQDFEPVTIHGEAFVPFLSGTYNGFLCYKMKITSLKELRTKYTHL